MSRNSHHRIDTVDIRGDEHNYSSSLVVQHLSYEMMRKSYPGSHAAGAAGGRGSWGTTFGALDIPAIPMPIWCYFLW